MADYRTLETLPRLPLEGGLDLTYRCNNRCRHCWLWEPDTESVAGRELSADEIHDIVEAARSLGCRTWDISGGEPMLRPDFATIFDHLTRRSAGYALNTNGTLITPEIARLMRHKGSKMVALYGATADVHDHITRAPGSFGQTMEGFARLREAGAGFVVQVVPLRDNHHQLSRMEDLARTLSRHWRIGAAWLFLSADGSAVRNAEIVAQRLDAADAVALDPPSPFSSSEDDGPVADVRDYGDERLLAACATGRGGFHVDPYGGLSICHMVKDPALRYDLRGGSFHEGWEQFIPALGTRVYQDAGVCAACPQRGDCRWCDVYGYLEHRRHGARVDYLCQVADEARVARRRVAREHRRSFSIAGLTIRVESELPITGTTFAAKFAGFAADGSVGDADRAGGGPADVVIQHSFDLETLDLELEDLGEPVYRQEPWAIHRRGRSWVYVGVGDEVVEESPHMIAVFSDDHTYGRVHHPARARGPWAQGGLHSLSMMPTDQIVLGRVLADRDACYVHSSGVVMAGQGLVFLGHSGAGKSTTMRLLDGRAEVLCDDRNILMHRDGQATVHGTWSHGEVPIVSAASAPLRALLFLRQADENRLVPVDGRLAAAGELASCVVKPLVTADWWHKTLALVDALVADVPCFEMRFDRSGAIVPRLEELVRP